MDYNIELRRIRKRVEKMVNIKKILRFILIIMIIINWIVIFTFSSEKSEKSNETSGRVINAIVESSPKTKNLSNKEKEKKKKELVVPVRKTAHFTVYAISGLLTYLCALTFEGKNRNRILISLLLAFLYACTDELHQLFVSGRSGEFKDVCIDTCGAAFGILFIYINYKIIKKIKKKT